MGHVNGQHFALVAVWSEECTPQRNHVGNARETVEAIHEPVFKMAPCCTLRTLMLPFRLIKKESSRLGDLHSILVALMDLSQNLVKQVV